MIVSFGFEINMVDECVYYKYSGSKKIVLVQYVMIYCLLLMI